MLSLRRTGVAFSAAALVVVIASQSSLQDATASQPQVVDNFQLVDHDGFARELYRLQDAKAVVIAMHVAGNDASRKAAATLATLKKKYPDVEFMMMNSSLDDARSAIEADAKAAGIAVPILDDDNQLIGESLGAAHAGEVFVIDPQGWRVVYRGAVDAKSAKKKSRGYLAEALAAVTADRPVTVAEVPVKGDAIAFPGREKAATFASISYADTVAPILEQKCVVCHQEGGIGPFAMDRHETVKGFAPMIREVVIADNTIKLPPQDGAHKEIAYVDFPKEALLYAAFPHAHYRGAYSDLTLRYPDGQEKLLLRLPKYDFNWQRYYSFAEPVKIPAGSKLIATYVYDNSPRNPANPDPAKEIVWGDQSFEEMFYTRLRYRWTDETAADQKNHEQLVMKTRMLGMMDDDVDGKIQPTELRGQLAAFAAHFPKADTNKDGGLDNDELQAALAAIRAMRSKPAASGGQ